MELTKKQLLLSTLSKLSQAPQNKMVLLKLYTPYPPALTPPPHIYTCLMIFSTSAILHRPTLDHTSNTSASNKLTGGSISTASESRVVEKQPYLKPSCMRIY